MKKTILSTGVEIEYNKKGNIKKLVSPHDNDKTYGQQCVDELSTLFKSFNNVR